VARRHTRVDHDRSTRQSVYANARISPLVFSRVGPNAQHGKQRLLQQLHQALFTANGYIPIMPRVTLALQFRIGRIVALDPNSQTYPNRQFFLGGVETMRGYPQDAMIPQELADLIARNQATSDAILRGGDAFMLLRAELRFPLFGPLQGGIFFDLGNLWAEAANLNPLKLRPTAGFGVRFETPVGPIAFDYGFVLLRRSTTAFVHWHRLFVR
jgi:outer membrane protein assembly factor BamA